MLEQMEAECERDIDGPHSWKLFGCSAYCADDVDAGGCAAGVDAAANGRGIGSV